MSPQRFYQHRRRPGVDPAKLTGTLIVIEGPDSSGRSTHIGLLRQWLEEQGYAVAQVGLKRSNLVAAELEKAKQGNILSPRTLSLFYATDFYDQLENQIVPALRAGFVVLADRYIYTLMARDIVRGAEPEWVESIYSMAPVPEAVFYLMVSSKTLVDRTFQSHAELDYWESGMDCGLGRDWFGSFLRYQRKIRQEFVRMQKAIRLRGGERQPDDPGPRRRPEGPHPAGPGPQREKLRSTVHDATGKTTAGKPPGAGRHRPKKREKKSPAAQEKSSAQAPQGEARVKKKAKPAEEGAQGFRRHELGELAAAELSKVRSLLKEVGSGVVDRLDGEAASLALFLDGESLPGEKPVLPSAGTLKAMLAGLRRTSRSSPRRAGSKTWPESRPSSWRWPARCRRAVMGSSGGSRRSSDRASRPAGGTMKVAFLSDIHANFPGPLGALEHAAEAGAEEVVVRGGPGGRRPPPHGGRPAPHASRASAAWRAMWSGRSCALAVRPQKAQARQDTRKGRPLAWTARALGEAELAWLARSPWSLRLCPGEVSGSSTGAPWRGGLPLPQHHGAGSRAASPGSGPAALVCGHSHIPFVKPWAGPSW